MESIVQSHWDFSCLGYQFERDSMLSALMKCFQNGLEDSAMVEVVARFASEADLIVLAVKSPHASGEALMEIASHPANAHCWIELLRHPNVTSKHMELLLSYEISPHWFAIERTMALSPHINDAIAYVLLERNSADTYGPISPFFQRKQSEKN